MIKLIVPALCAALVGSTAYAERPSHPDSFIGGSIDAVTTAYGAPVYETTLEDGRDVLVFELTSYETSETAARMNYRDPSATTIAARRSLRANRTQSQDRSLIGGRGMSYQVSATSDGYGFESRLSRADQHRFVPVKCVVGAALDSEGRVQDMVVSDPACRTISSR